MALLIAEPTSRVISTRRSDEGVEFLVELLAHGNPSSWKPRPPRMPPGGRTSRVSAAVNDIGTRR